MQRIIISVFCIAVAFTFFYVPWEVRYIHKDWFVKKTEYHLIWSIPEEDQIRRAKIDSRILALEILGITALGTMAFTLAGAFKKKIKEGDK